MSKSRWIVCFSLIALSLTACSHNKELEQQNREQAHVIADLNQQVGNLQSELSQMKSSQAAAAQGTQPVVSGGSQKSYVK